MSRRRNPLSQLVFPRFQQVANRVGQMKNLRSTDLAVEAGPVNRDFVDLAGARTQTFSPIAPGDRFGLIETGVGGQHLNNLWTNRWLRIKVPAAQAAEERGNRWLAWSCNGETTVYIDGEAWAGLDPSHLSCPLPDEACELWLDVSLYHTAIGGPGYKTIDNCGVEFMGAKLEIRDPEAWATYQDLDLLTTHLERCLAEQGIKLPRWLLGQFPEIKSASPLLRQLLAGAEDVCDAFATGGLPALRETLKRLLARFPAETWQPKVHLVGQSHLDLVWMWPEAATVRKGLHTIATTLRLLERYPEFRFTISQPAFLRALEVEAPKQYAELCRYIKEGRVELLGAFEVEPDTHMPCGEALARSLVQGQGLIKELSGKPSNICWLPDAFGFTGCLPQILRLAGVDAFYTAKMLCNSINRFPYVAFTWRGNDGSGVDALSVSDWNNTLNIDPLQNEIRAHSELGLFPEMLLCVGVGDGGGGVTEGVCERASRMKNQAGLPRVEWSTAKQYFAAQAAVRDRLPVYQGEIYLELHQGTFTTQTRYKGSYRKLERALQTWEAARALTGGAAIDAKPWQRLAFAQFHDALPGSSIGLVYKQLGGELDQRAADAMASAEKELGRADGAVVVFNPLPIARKAVVAIPGRHKGLAADGRALEVQPAGDDTLALIDLPGLSAVEVRPGDAAGTGQIKATPEVLDNGRVAARFDAGGQLSSLCVDGVEMRLAAPAGLRMHYDQPAFHDAWDIDHDAFDHVLPLPAPSGFTVVEKGPIRGRIRTVQKIGESSQATIDFVVEAGQPWLQVEMTVEWHERHKMLKFHVPTGYQGRMARFATPFGSVLRPQLAGGPQEEAMWEVPATRWLSVTDDTGEGLAAITEASYGASVRDGCVGLTLLRGTTSPDPEADQGTHCIRFAIGRHMNGTDADGTAAAADRLYTPAVVLAHGAAMKAPFTWTRTGTLVPSWVEPIDGGIVLRAHEAVGTETTAELRFAKAPKSAEYVDFLGNSLGALQRKDETTFIVPARAYQIVSVRVRW